MTGNNRNSHCPRLLQNVLPEGDYPFSVTDVERMVPVSEASPRRAIIHMIVDGGDLGKTHVKVPIQMCRTSEWIIAQFLHSIGSYRFGQLNPLNWPDFVGSQGKAHFRPKTVTIGGHSCVVLSLVRFIDSLDHEIRLQECLPVPF